MTKRALMVVLPLLLLGACGGDNGGPDPVVTPTPTPVPAATPTPVPTPTPPPNYTGTYVGTMNFTISGVPAGSFNTRLEVTQDGNTIQLGTLTLPGFGDFPLKDATLTSATDFAGSAGYQSAGCGRVKVSTQGNFVGNDMHLIAGLTSDCVQARLSGDLSR